MKTTHAWRMAVLLAVLGMYGNAWAQTVPAPKEFYFDEDRSTTRNIVVVPGEGDAVLDKLAAIIQRDPRAADARAQLGAIAIAGGRRELGDQLFKAALGSLASGSQQYRLIAWNYGWALYRAGDVEQALHQWLGLAAGRPATPDWLPPTLALALWKLGRKDEAVAWYAASVRTWPDKWSDPGALATTLPDWREDERASLAEVLSAWQAHPPAWP